jgi:hypothetical protein
MGYKVINQSDYENVDHGRGWGVAAVCVGFAHIGIVIVVLIFVWGIDADSLDKGQYAYDATNADATVRDLVELAPRDCFDDSALDKDRVGILHAVECDKAHDAEVIDLIPMASFKYPGQTAIDKQARACVDSFADYVGITYAKSELELTYYYPTRASWPEPGTHAITCIVHAHQGPLRSSVWRAER